MLWRARCILTLPSRVQWTRMLAILTIRPNDREMNIFSFISFKYRLLSFTVTFFYYISSPPNPLWHSPFYFLSISYDTMPQTYYSGFGGISRKLCTIDDRYDYVFDLFTNKIGTRYTCFILMYSLFFFFLFSFSFPLFFQIFFSKKRTLKERTKNFGLMMNGSFAIVHASTLARDDSLKHILCGGGVIDICRICFWQELVKKIISPARYYVYAFVQIMSYISTGLSHWFLLHPGTFAVG